MLTPLGQSLARVLKLDAGSEFIANIVEKSLVAGLPQHQRIVFVSATEESLAICQFFAVQAQNATPPANGFVEIRHFEGGVVQPAYQSLCFHVCPCLSQLIIGNLLSGFFFRYDKRDMQSLVCDSRLIANWNQITVQL